MKPDEEWLTKSAFWECDFLYLYLHWELTQAAATNFKQNTYLSKNPLGLGWCVKLEGHTQICPAFIFLTGFSLVYSMYSNIWHFLAHVNFFLQQWPFPLHLQNIWCLESEK